ncbi:MAG: deoxyguanosinetriphosphate triphosphohydrolase [Clostridia bacterium]|nr:deoxyguanosinetriphosphate triphosphohydrolase [Clostridia bacterium]MBQ4327373.1 deoxyguanosinetriphosphate triphosphohydrolase [Clostridia bacterium]
MSENYIRELFLEREKSTLSPYAFLTSNTRGREHPYTPCPVRTEFQRDRDRVIHSTSFRRLMHKTQVFLMPVDDHYRTRLTHTLEVSQIARIIARGLRLNEDLTEAIALGHDLGHTPFGHAGEDAMRACYDPDFAHYKQSLRVVEKLERGGKGLNLTWEVRDGIVNHTGKHMASTLEGVIVKFADRIAYINHDIDDAVRAGILRPEDIPAELRAVLGERHSERINKMVLSVITASTDRPEIRMTDEIQQATDALRRFMFENVYEDKVAKHEDDKSKALLISLYEYFCRNPEKMPREYFVNVENEGVERCVCDYVSGMTDRYAIELYNELYVPQVWGGKR